MGKRNAGGRTETGQGGKGLIVFQSGQDQIRILHETGRCFRFPLRGQINAGKSVGQAQGRRVGPFVQQQGFPAGRSGQKAGLNALQASSANGYAHKPVSRRCRFFRSSIQRS